ncbi:MAG: hypothetical protein QMD09_12150 [Desulfatibacillaceae bacterium]|nr:hypothetical protein [Desulfatibacillaceae bacterium]
MVDQSQSSATNAPKAVTNEEGRGLAFRTPAQDAAIAKRWARAKELDAIKRARQEKRAMRIARFKEIAGAPFKKVQAFGQKLLAPWYALLLKMEQWQEAREKARQEKLEKTRPAREAAAKIKWEKKKARQEARKALFERWKAGTVGLRKALGLPVRAFIGIKKGAKSLFLAPYEAFLIAREAAAKKREAKRQLRLAGTAQSRAEKAQAKHAKMVQKHLRRQARREAWARRLSGVGAAWRAFRRFWSQTTPIRRILYLIILIYLAFRYRFELVAWFDSFFGFDLQRLLK